MTLTSTEREAVIAQYGIVRLSHDKCYSEILQQFILKEFNKKESADNIRHLINYHFNKKRKHKVDISLEVTKASQALDFKRDATYKNQCEFCIQLSPKLAEISRDAIIYHLKKLGPPRYKRRLQTLVSDQAGPTDGTAKQSEAPTSIMSSSSSSSSSSSMITTTDSFSILTFNLPRGPESSRDDAADHIELSVGLRDESLVVISAAIDDVVVVATVSAVGANLGSVNDSREGAENLENPTADQSGAQASTLSTTDMMTKDLSRSSTFYPKQGHEGGSNNAAAQIEFYGLENGPDIDIPAEPAAAEVVEQQAVDIRESTGRRLIGEFSIASITVEQMKIDRCNIVVLAGKDARDHYTNDLKTILPESHRVSLAEDDSGDEYMFLYYTLGKLVGCIFLNVGDNCEEITVYWLYTSPALQQRRTRLGFSIVQKLFAAFPDAVFKLCAKREAAPFWFKMGFLPADQKIDMER
jgi:hypothetical protein